MNRAERRRISRDIGKQTPWVEQISPKKSGVKNKGWFSELDKAWSNGKYVVMARNIQTEWGAVTHACIRNAASTDIPWREKQRIKNELFGTERFAFEVFPPKSQLVDEANMYHLWIFPLGVPLPFNLNHGSHGGS